MISLAQGRCEPVLLTPLKTGALKGPRPAMAKIGHVCYDTAMEEKRFLRVAEVMKKVGLSQPTLWRMMKKGAFPKSRQLGEGSVAWYEHEIDEWMESRPVGKRCTGADFALRKRLGSNWKA
jgi:prophage regulatory protein